MSVLVLICLGQNQKHSLYYGEFVLVVKVVCLFLKFLHFSSFFAVINSMLSCVSSISVQLPINLATSN